MGTQGLGRWTYPSISRLAARLRRTPEPVLTRLFVTRPTLATVVVLLALIGGVLAAVGLREQELPNVDLPAATIVVTYSSATPAEMRDSIV
jgi:multidrug efflux pump subunit AcrB